MAWGWSAAGLCRESACRANYAAEFGEPACNHRQRRLGSWVSKPDRDPNHPQRLRNARYIRKSSCRPRCRAGTCSHAQVALEDVCSTSVGGCWGTTVHRAWPAAMEECRAAPAGCRSAAPVPFTANRHRHTARRGDFLECGRAALVPDAEYQAVAMDRPIHADAGACTRVPPPNRRIAGASRRLVLTNRHRRPRAGLGGKRLACNDWSRLRRRRHGHWRLGLDRVVSRPGWRAQGCSHQSGNQGCPTMLSEHEASPSL